MSNFPEFQAVVHSVTEVLVEGTSEGHLIKPPPEARLLPSLNPFSNDFIENLQGFHSLSEQPVPALHPAHEQIFLTSSLRLPSSNLQL